MTETDDWLERQYWADVMAVLPEQEIEQRIATSKVVRSSNPRYLDQAYGKEDRQKLDLFVPDGNGPWPLLVYVHGGYWKRGIKDEYAFLAETWLDNGVAVAIPGYRLAPEVTLPEIVADVRAACALLARSASSFGIDTSRVVLSGLSAGAHLIAMEMTSSNTLSPSAAILLSGVFDPRPLESTSVGPFLTDSLQLNFDELSPLGRPPPPARCLIAWGAEETEVFKNQSRTLASHWRNWGVKTELHEVAGANHFTILNHMRADRDGPLSLLITDSLLSE